ncbi:subclass B1 metallo-beta-lactamase [Thalassotalea ponticola]|uniref:subclass B1 metallo-beta-lactamase n=1 Tax=Thalassotalea ponticola TaxID=1523392 RepID=UPI0025B457CC|nr:subclass B1 metallo-beta-lactamase [Thalassotalea ponticola]MDN3651669.1 subclass B1 metallo-beta-lactamase [Thalassotalea ponticola]
MRHIIFIALFIPLLVYSSSERTEELKIIKLRDNTYQHISFKTVEPWGLIGASGLVVINGNDAHIIDTPWTTSGTRQLLQWITSKGMVVRSAVVTHFHDDASGGIALLNDLNIPTYATSLTNELLQLNGNEMSTDVILGNPYELINGGASIFYPGPGHTEDNIVVWLSNEKILFGGCFVKSLNNKSIGFTGDANINAWPESLQNVINRYPDVQIVVPGHGKIGDITLLTHTQSLAVLAKTGNSINNNSNTH